MNDDRISLLCSYTVKKGSPKGRPRILKVQAVPRTGFMLGFSALRAVFGRSPEAFNLSPLSFNLP